VKVLFFILLIFNSVFFLWELSRENKLDESPESTRSLAANGNVARIILQNELSKVNKSTERPQPDKPVFTSQFRSISIDMPGLIQQAATKSITETLSSQTTALLQSEVSRHLSKSEDILALNASQPHINVFESEPDFQLYKPKTENFDKNNLQGCYKLGPFFSQSESYRIFTQINADGEKARRQTELADKATGFMVIYPSAETLEKSKENVKFLRSLGIKDMWLINTGKLQGAISLGIFNRLNTAEIMRDELHTQGILAEIKPKLSKKIGHFLFIAWNKAKSQLVSMLRELKIDPELLIKLESEQICSTKS